MTSKLYLRAMMLIILVILLVSTSASASKSKGRRKKLAVKTPYGRVIGSTASVPGGTAEMFLGIPYAKPPLGALRFKPPQALRPKKGSKFINGLSYKLACPQIPGFLLPGPFDEDCLYLNIFRPKTSKKKLGQKLPVFFFIHGGGLFTGSANTPFYNLSRLAVRGEMVIVTVNYRLGILAYLMDERITAAGVTNGGANGLLDMIQALKWVQTSIGKFGGDPTKVTIAGQSGGAWAVCYLMVSPAASGLFDRAIQQSGSCVDDTFGSALSYVQGVQRSRQFLAANNASTVDDLRNIPAQVLVLQIQNAFLPSADGVVLPLDKTVTQLYQSPQTYLNPSAVILGTMFDDTFLRVPTVPGIVGRYPTAANEFSTYLQLYLPQAPQLVAALAASYPVGPNPLAPNDASIYGSDAGFTWAQMLTDFFARCATLSQLEYLKNAGIPVYFYQFGGPRAPWDHATHGNDLEFTFDIDPQVFTSPVSDVLLKDVVSNLWSRFITSSPVGFRETVWDPVHAPSGNDGSFLLVYGLPQNRNISSVDYIVDRCSTGFAFSPAALKQNSIFVIFSPLAPP